MEEEVGGPLISTNCSDISQLFALQTFSNIFTETTKNENVIEANDLLRNGILIETPRGVEWFTLTDALASGVGDLNLSVEDFQNVAAQVLNSERNGNNDLTVEPKYKCLISEDNSNSLQSYFSITPLSSKLESIEETAEHFKVSEEEETVDNTSDDISVKSKKKTCIQKQKHATSDGSSSIAESTNSDSSSRSISMTQVKRKGGWPKGRKRKPESENRPPKAPSTGYVFFLNEKRKMPIYKDIPFPQVTKLLGNEWSKLSLAEKKSYLERAETDKKRYREELRIYRNSEAYQAYLRRKRIKSLQANGTEESDIDATDEIEDEDNEELYCRVCDQWFTTLHNKKEHLYGRQHFQSLSRGNSSQCRASDASSTFSLDESSLDTPFPNQRVRDPSPTTVTDAMANFMSVYSEREKEIAMLQENLKKSLSKNIEIVKELKELKLCEQELTSMLNVAKLDGEELEESICLLYRVPSLLLDEGDEEELDV